MSGIETDIDVLIIGGGPAGTTAATLLAERGHRVLLAERTKFPRFHIGESMLPAGDAVLERLGVLERARGLGVEKLGATFSHHAGSANGAVVFARGMDNRPSAIHVERAKFDQLLLERSREAGAEVLEECRVSEVELLDSHVVVQLKKAGGSEPTRVSARFLIDASGQSGFLAKRLGLRQKMPDLDQVAIYSRFEGVEDWGEVPAGDIQVVSRDDMGWCWLIPLSETSTSVGVVLRKSEADRLRRAGLRYEQILESTLRQSTVTKQRMANASKTEAVRVSVDFSYGCESYARQNWLLAGDAGSFLDPVFSTGVLLALESGAEAADCLDQVLAGRQKRQRAFERYDQVQRRRFEFFRFWVEGFYDPAYRDLFCQPSPRFQLVDAIATVLAGNHGPPLSVRWRLRLFRFIWWLQRRIPLAHRLHVRNFENANFEYSLVAESAPSLEGAGASQRLMND